MFQLLRLRLIVCFGLPNYNWRKAKSALKEKFGDNMEKLGGTTFNTDFGKNFENEVDLRNVDRFHCTFNWRTYLLSFIGYYVGGIGITAGDHRLFATNVEPVS